MKIKKGDYGYIDNNKKFSCIKALTGLSVILIIFVTGIIITKTRLNWFTFVSVLCALPVGRMVVACIMAWPHQSMSEDKFNIIRKKGEGICLVYDMVITSYEKIMQIDCVAIKGNTICAYSTDAKLMEDTSSKYIKDILANNGCSCTFKIYKDFDAFLNRMEEMKDNLSTQEKSDAAKEREKNKEMKVVETLLAISI